MLLEKAVSREDPAVAIKHIRIIRGELNDLLGLADTYESDTELGREAAAFAQDLDAWKARENADIREEMIRRGEATAEQLDAAGYLSHEKLDELAGDAPPRTPPSTHE